MDIKYNKEKLAKILETVYELLQTPISIFDKDFKYITSYPPDGYLTEFCSIIRESESRRELCRRSDEESCARCQSSKNAFSYRCHAGIRETVTPIRFEKTVIGYILFGEYRIADEAPDLVSYARENGICEQRLKEAYSKLRLLSESQVAATCTILESCVLQFWLSDAIFLSENDLAEQIKRFIDENLAEPLRIEDICKNFFISRQRVYSVFRESFGTTVKAYVLERRIERAKHLLKATEGSVTEIAERSGFSDYNNFIQRFKKITGVTPLQFRRNQ